MNTAILLLVAAGGLYLVSQRRADPAASEPTTAPPDGLPPMQEERLTVVGPRMDAPVVVSSSTDDALPPLWGAASFQPGQVGPAPVPKYSPEAQAVIDRQGKFSSAASSASLAAKSSAAIAKAKADSERLAAEALASREPGSSATITTGSNSPRLGAVATIATNPLGVTEYPDPLKEVAPPTSKWTSYQTMTFNPSTFWLRGYFSRGYQAGAPKYTLDDWEAILSKYGPGWAMGEAQQTWSMAQNYSSDWPTGTDTAEQRATAQAVWAKVYPRPPASANAANDIPAAREWMRILTGSNYYTLVNRVRQGAGLPLRSVPATATEYVPPERSQSPVAPVRGTVATTGTRVGGTTVTPRG